MQKFSKMTFLDQDVCLGMEKLPRKFQGIILSHFELITSFCEHRTRNAIDADSPTLSAVRHDQHESLFFFRTDEKKHKRGGN